MLDQRVRTARSVTRLMELTGIEDDRPAGVHCKGLGDPSPGVIRSSKQAPARSAAAARRGGTGAESADEHPHGVFVEDALVVFGDLAVMTSPGRSRARGELATVAPAVERLGLAFQRIELPGMLDGGDVLEVGHTVYVGRSTRTNDAGAEQLRALFAPAGRKLVSVPVTKVLHVKSAVTAQPGGPIIGRSANVFDPGAFSGLLEVPDDQGTAVVDFGGGAVLMSAAAPRTAALLRARGVQPVAVPITEFEKLEGCVTCLSVRVCACLRALRLTRAPHGAPPGA